MYCKHCGHEVKDTEFCPNCGARILSKPQVVQNAPPSAQEVPPKGADVQQGEAAPAPRSKKKTSVAVYIAIAALLLAAAGFCLVIVFIDPFHWKSNKYVYSPDYTIPIPDYTIPVPDINDWTTLPSGIIQPVESAPITSPAEETAESFFSGIWQGTGENVTTIQINPDHTLWYRELESKKADTVNGFSGTWSAAGKNEIMISLPSVGGGYELKGTADRNGGFLLQCTNGKTWFDETIYKTHLTAAKLEDAVQRNLKSMVPDGGYQFSLWTENKDFDFSSEFSERGDYIYVFRQKEDGLYLRLSKNMIETTFPLFNYSSWYDTGKETTENKEGFVKKIPIGKNCNYHGFGFTQEEIYQRIKDPNSSWYLHLEFTVENGEITSFSFP